MRSQPDSSWPPSAVVRSVSCCKTSAAGSAGSALRRQVAVGRRRGHSAPWRRSAEHAREVAPATCLATPKALRPRSPPKTPAGRRHCCREATATRQWRASPREISTPPAGKRPACAGAWAIRASPASNTPATSNGKGPSGVSKAPASRRETMKTAATASSAATADRK